MKKSKKKSKKIKKINILLIILLISMFIVIPNLLISIQREIEIPIEEKNPNEIINIRPPQESSVYYEDTTGSARGVYVSGDYAYVADDTSGLAVIDISDPTNPGTPIYENTIGSARGVYVSGDYAYVADTFSGLAVIDISDPTNPGTPVYEDTTGEAHCVYVSGDYAYVADSTSGLGVIDISDPTTPGTPAYADTTKYAYDIYVSGDYAYLADLESGLAIIDISDPTNPGTPVYEDTSGGAIGVYVSGDYAYVADGPSGLAVIQVRKRVAMENPIISNAPSDLTVEAGYTGQSLSWTATDANPDTYTIELNGTGIVVSSTPWANNAPVVYNNPDGFSPGVYAYTITFTDEGGNSISNTVTVTIKSIPEGGIPFGNFFLIFIGFSVICLIFAKKRQIVRESR
ncbi:MAG: hypothetical protein CEE42_04550 [Promethearchaeota archaeon Loki_b31]|nr:MAG: hypothetical protein CEE42_04550 [Candidatus Lokiarchaeota archaeon Loki_b31]